MSLFNRLVVGTLPLVPKFVVGKVAKRYVAGETLEDAFATVSRLASEGVMATLDILGEEVTARDKALWAVAEYIRIFHAIRERDLDANVSIKLTLLGLRIDQGFCRDNVERIVSAARDDGNFVRIDMEDHTTTDATLAIYRELFPQYRNLGVVLQAYMRRTLRDITQLPPEGASVRLCKGIYIEPRAVAWKGFETVRANFLAALEKLLSHDVHVGIATHDEFLVQGATALLDRYGVARDRYEFQMLLGVEAQLRRVLVAAGHRVRVYVPYGQDWYPYSVRRLRENPEIARHVLRGLFASKSV